MKITKRIRRVERLLQEACGAVTAMGWTIAPCEYINYTAKKCCPQGAVSIVCNPSKHLICHSDDTIKVIERVLKINYLERQQIAWGFDSVITDVQTPFESLGLSFRLRLNGFKVS